MSTEYFTLTLPEFANEISVTSLVGTEAMSSLYRFDVRALVVAEEGFARRGVEAPAVLSFHASGATARTVHGIVELLPGNRASRRLRCGVRVSASSPAWLG